MTGKKWGRPTNGQLLDVQRLREETGATAEGVYLNNARISPMPRPAYRAIRATLDREYRRGWSVDEQEAAISGARAALGDLLGASSAEIAIAQSASYGINLVVNGLEWRRGDNVVLTDLAYRSVAQAALRLQEERGVEVRFARSDGLFVEPPSVMAVVDERTRLVVVPYVPVFCGVVQPVVEIGQRVRDTPALYAVNATQAAGQLPIDVGALGCDFLFGTSRKWLRGPRGLGYLYVRPALIPTLRPTHIGYPAGTWTDTATVEVTPTVERLHVGDYPYTLLVGLAASVRYALAAGVDAIASRNRRLGECCRSRLAAVRGVEIYDQGQGITGTVPCNVRGLDADATVAALGARGITVCSLYARDALLGLRKLGQEKVVRVSAHYYNTEDEIDALARELEGIAAGRG